MIFQSPSDVAFSIFNLPIYFYGITLALAIFAGVYSAYRLTWKFYPEQNAENIIDFSPYIIVVGVLGARLYYCLLNYTYYFAHPLEILDIRQGGLSIHGMIVIGILALYIFAKNYKMSFLKLFDVFMCGTALAQAIGRWGNFFNSEAFGYPTNLPWKLFIPIAQRPPEYANVEYFHPTFLYESILDLIIFFILLMLFKRFFKKPGLIAFTYLVLYSIARLFVEHIRLDSALNINGVPVAQIASVVMMFIGYAGFILVYNKKF